MRMQTWAWGVVAAALVVLASTGTAPAKEHGGNLRIGVGISAGDDDGMQMRRGSGGEDFYAAGGSVEVAEAVKGDIVAAGGRVEVTASAGANVIVAGGEIEVTRSVGQDLLAAGGTVEIGGRVADDVRTAGGTVEIEAVIGGDLLAAGGEVSLERSAQVQGQAWLAGGDVEVDGTVRGLLSVSGGNTMLNGTFGGDVEVTAEYLTVGPNARIAGRLIHKGPNAANIAAEAQIAGGIEYVAAPQPMVLGGPGWAGAFMGVLGVVLTLLTTATVLRWVFPAPSLRGASLLSAHPWRSLALGFALLLCVPVAAVVLLITVVGIPLGIAALLLYPILLALSLYLPAVWIAAQLERLMLGRGPVPIGWRVVLMWVAVLMLALIGLVPYVGQLVLFVAMLLGLGALGGLLAEGYRGRPVVV